MNRQLIGIVLGLGLLSMGSYATMILAVQQITGWPILPTLLAAIPPGLALNVAAIWVDSIVRPESPTTR